MNKKASKLIKFYCDMMGFNYDEAKKSYFELPKDMKIKLVEEMRSFRQKAIAKKAARKKMLLEKMVVIKAEIQFNCGDGGKSQKLTHGLKCNCKKLNAEIVNIRKELEKLKKRGWMK